MYAVTDGLIRLAKPVEEGSSGMKSKLTARLLTAGGLNLIRVSCRRSTSGRCTCGLGLSSALRRPERGVEVGDREGYFPWSVRSETLVVIRIAGLFAVWTRRAHCPLHAKPQSNGPLISKTVRMHPSEFRPGRCKIPKRRAKLKTYE